MLKLVCFGDSITVRSEGTEEARLTARIKMILNNWEIINAGIAGNNTRDALLRIETDVIIHNPDLVTVFFGANDSAFHKMIELDEYEKNLMEITNQISPLKTILISPAPVDERLQNARTNVVLKQYADTVKRVAKHTGSYFIDLYSEMTSVSDYKEMLKSVRNDGLHFGEYGYAYLSNLIADKIKTIQ